LSGKGATRTSALFAGDFLCRFKTRPKNPYIKKVNDMRKKKYPPLTDAERALAKGMNGWWHQRKQFQLPSDMVGNWYTKKNVGDVADLYLHERNGLVFLDGSSVERDELVTIVSRYRAEKSAETRHKKRKRRLRVLSRRLNAAGEVLKRLIKERELAKKREKESRQGSFSFP
jgi:hypothetical protein